MKATVLVLNRNWQAINVRTPPEAFCMMATNVAIDGEALQNLLMYMNTHKLRTIKGPSHTWLRRVFSTAALGVVGTT